jgi:hypothetical protein
MTKLYGYSTEEGEGYRTKQNEDWIEATADGEEFDGQTCFICDSVIEEGWRVWVTGVHLDKYACHHHPEIVRRPDGTRPLG